MMYRLSGNFSNISANEMGITPLLKINVQLSVTNYQLAIVIGR